MANRDPYSLPPAVRRAATSLRLVGWISFWTQIVLAVISGVVLFFAAISARTAPTTVTPTTPGIPNVPVTVNPSTGAGSFLAVVGLLTLFAGAYWAFRYTRLARRLKTADSQTRLKKGEAIQALNIGLIINLSGMLLTIFGAQATIGSLVAKSARSIGNIFTGGFQSFITPLDLFVVQANTNTIMAHFVGLLATLWILRSVNRQ